MTATNGKAVIDGFQQQIEACRAMGSEFSAKVLEILATDFAKQGPVYELAKTWDERTVADAMTLRLLGGLHRLVLSGNAPGLIGHYPCHSGSKERALDAAVIQTVALNQEWLAEALHIPPQTNEIGRSFALLGGFLEIAKKTSLPLRLREIGASAGLNLLWYLFRYETDTFSWGDESSQVVLRAKWEGAPPAVELNPVIQDRRGCDISPVDVRDDEACTLLRSFVWADQTDRLQRLDKAIGLARNTDYSLAKASADDWLRAQLGTMNNGSCTVVFHSIMWQYMPDEFQSRIGNTIQGAGKAATDQAPIAWLRLEPPKPKSFPEIRLTFWPGGEERVLGTGHFHGAWVRWNG